LPRTGSRHLGPYELIAPLGAGGMGEVWRARDPRIRRDVAIKLIAEDLARDPEWHGRFEREARAAGALNHPNILTVHDLGSDNGTPYLVTELLEGETLRQVLARDPLPMKKAVAYAIQITEGLATAHAAGIVHRDLKPENLFVTRDGRVKILDFGLARRMRERGQGASFATATGFTTGTPGYMAPEQVRGEDADARADLFAFGCVLYEMLTGQPPFGRGLEAFHHILNEEPRPAAELRPEVPGPLAALVHGCLEKDRERRFQSAHDLTLALRALEGSTGRIEERPAGARSGRVLVVVSVTVIAVAAAAVWAGSRFARHDPPRYQRMTWRRGALAAARFAPDGHTLVYAAAWDGGPVRIYTARTEGPESSPLDLPQAGLAAVSSNGELALLLGYELDLFNMRDFTLARVPLGGGAPRAVAEHVIDADWNPDGSALAVARLTPAGVQIEYPVGTVLYRTAGGISFLRFSPRGDAIAFIDHPINGDDRGAVAIVDLRGRKRMLTPVGTGETGLAWSRRGDAVWFSAIGQGIEGDVWAVDLHGHSHLVTRTPGRSVLRDISRDGRVLLSLDDFRARAMFQGPADRQARDLSILDWSLTTDLSDDGRTLLIGEESAGMGTNYAGFLRPTDGGPAVKLGQGEALSLSPDGRWVLSLTPTPDQHLLLVPTGPGEPRTLARGHIAVYRWGRWMPDGAHVIFSGYETGRQTRLFVQSIAPGAPPRPVTPEGVSDYNVEATDLVSPDGRWVTVADPDTSTMLYPVAGGAPRSVPGLARGETALQWSAGGTTLFVGAPRHLPAWRIDQLDVRTGRRTPWRTIAPADPAGVLYLTAPRFAHEGSSLAYTEAQYLSKLFMVTGLR
jgi:eukaryotic-like serine/threonine-protein kinase